MLASLVLALTGLLAFAPLALANRRHHRRHGASPQVSWTLPATVSEGQPVAFSWSGRNLGRDHKLVIQKPVGTAHTWRSIMLLNGNGGTAELPGLALGKYRFRIADLAPAPRPRRRGRRPHLRVLAKDAASIAVFGEVPFTTLFAAEERAYTGPQFSFPFVVDWSGAEAEWRGSTVFQVEHNHCSAVHIAFVPSPQRGELNEASYTGTLTLVQESREAVNASAAYKTIGSLDAELTPGQTWGVTAQYTGHNWANIYINGYAICDSTEAFS